MPEFSPQEEKEQKQLSQRELLYPRVKEKGNMVVIVRVLREPTQGKEVSEGNIKRNGYELAVVLERVLLIPRKWRDLDLDRVDLALLVLRLSSSSSSSYFALWIL